MKFWVSNFASGSVQQLGGGFRLTKEISENGKPLERTGRKAMGSTSVCYDSPAASVLIMYLLEGEKTMAKKLQKLMAAFLAIVRPQTEQ